jgi:hypothetical protein
MPRRCLVCLHPERAAIDRAIVAVEPFRHIARRFSISSSAVVRHKNNHLLPQIAKVRQVPDAPEAAALAAQAQREHEAEEATQALDVVRQLKAINAACLEVLTKARSAGNDATLLRAVDRIHRQIDLQARLLGDLQDAPTVNVLVMPEWQRVRILVVETLRPFPEARAAVVEALTRAGA